MRVIDTCQNRAIEPGNEIRVTIGPQGVVTLGPAGPIYTRGPARFGESRPRINEDYVRPHWWSGSVAEFEHPTLLAGLLFTGAFRKVKVYGAQGLCDFLGSLEFKPSKMLSTNATHIKVLADVAAMRSVPHGFAAYNALKTVEVSNPKMLHDCQIFMGGEAGTVWHMAEPVPTTRPRAQDILKVYSPAVKYTYVLDPAQFVCVQIEPVRKSSWSHLAEEYL